MSGPWFLVLAAVLILVGSTVLWWRARTPTSTASGVDRFNREMQALGRLTRADDGVDGEAEAEASPRRSDPATGGRP